MTIEQFGVSCVLFCVVAGAYSFYKAMSCDWQRRRSNRSRLNDHGQQMRPRDISVLREGENAG